MRILQVVHGYPPYSVGGTEVFVRALVRELGRRHEVAVFCRINEKKLNEYELVERRVDGISVWCLNNRLAKLNSFEMLYRNHEITVRFRAVLKMFNPDLVHVHHLTLLSTDIIQAAKEAAVPVVMTLHDYWMICQRGQMLMADETNCPEQIDERCDVCLPKGRNVTGVAVRASRFLDRWVPGFSNPDSRLHRLVLRLYEAATGTLAGKKGTPEIERVRIRQSHVREMLGLVDAFVAPSRYMKGAYVRFGVPAERIIHSDYGFELEKLGPVQEPARGPVRFGFLGSLIPSKGVDRLITAYGRISAPKGPLRIGGSFASHAGLRWYEKYVRRLAAENGAELIGGVDTGRIGEFLKEIDVLVVPSLWQENSPLVINEAFASCLPVIAGRVGGIPELVEDGVNGLLFEAGDVEGLASAMTRLCDRGTLEALQNGIKPVKTIADNSLEYERLYEGVRAKVSAGPRILTKSEPHVWVIVLNFNAKDDAIRCIESLEACLPAAKACDRGNLHILLVDNASTDGTIEAVRESHPRVETLALGENLGCAGGYNAGMRYAHERDADYYLLLNGDVILAADAVGRLVAAAEADLKAAVMGAKVCRMRQPHIIESAGSRFDRKSGRTVQIGAGEVDRGQYDGTRAVDGVLGCAILARGAAVERFGMLAEEFFCYFEETEWCLRAADAGWGVITVGGATVWHRGWGAQGGRQTPEAIYYGIRNQLMTVKRHGSGGPLQAIWRPLRVVVFGAAWLMLKSNAPKLPAAVCFIKGVRDYCLRKVGSR